MVRHILSIHEEKSPAPNMSRAHDLWVMRHVLYRCASTAALLRHKLQLQIQSRTGNIFTETTVSKMVTTTTPETAGAIIALATATIAMTTLAAPPTTPRAATKTTTVTAQ